MNTQPNAAGQGSALFPAGIPEPVEGSVEPLNGSCHALTLPVVSIRLAAESTVAVPYGSRAKVERTADAAAILRPYFRDKATEEFVVMLLSSAGHVTAIGRAAMGGLSGVSVEPRTVFQFALLGNAASIIVAHNHPSGNPEPSETDVALTRQLIAAGKVMGIPVLDHVIVAGSAHSSVMQGAADATAPFPAALGTLPGTTPEIMPAETRYPASPALAANEPRAAYTPKTLSANEPERPYLCSNGDSERHHAACESIEVLLHKDDFTTQVCRLVLRMLSLRNCGFILVEYSHEFMELVSLIAEVVGETGLTLDEANLLISADLTHDKRNPSTTAPAVERMKEPLSASRWFGPGFPSDPPSVKEPPADYSSIPLDERKRRMERSMGELERLAPHYERTIGYANLHAHGCVLVSMMAIALNHGADVQSLENLFWRIEEYMFCTDRFGASFGFPLKIRDKIRALQNPTRQDTYSPGGSIPDSSLLGEPRHEYNPDPGPVFRQKLFSMVAMTGDNLTIYLVGEWVEVTRAGGETRTMLGLDFDVDVNRETLGVPPSVNEPRSSYTPEPVTAPVRGAIVARTTRANGLTTTVYFTTRLVWEVGEDGELRRAFQLNLEAVTEAVSDSTAVNEPRHHYRAHGRAIAEYGLDAIDEILKPYSSREAETIRCATRIAYCLNVGAAPDDDVVALLTVLYCTPNYGAALLPFDVEQHLRQAVKPGTLAAISDGPRVNEPRHNYRADTLHVSGSTLHRLLNPLHGLRYYHVGA